MDDDLCSLCSGPKTYKHPKSNQLVYKMVSMVAVGDARGHLHIYDLSGDKAAEYDTGHGAPLTTLSFEGLDGESCRPSTLIACAVVASSRRLT